MASSPGTDGAPNVLIFMPDQQNGATVLPGCPALTPNLDRFRQDGITFNSAYCPAPHCCPSRATFLTGLYPSEHGVFNNVTTDTAIHEAPYPGTPYWGAALRDAGYQMGYAGKLHIGRNISPEDAGFESLDGRDRGFLAPLDDAQRLHRWQRANQDHCVPPERRPGEILRPNWGNVTLYSTLQQSYRELGDYKIAQSGIAGFQQMAANGKPWCVMISNNGAHDTYDAPQEFVDMYDLDDIELPPSFGDTLDDKPRVYQRQRYEYWSQLSDTEVRDAIRHYYAMVTMQDAIFGDILQALEETGQAHNTIVIYVSDHGDYLGAHGLWMKGIPAFQEAYHIPALVRWPRGAKQPGRNIDAIVDLSDFGPTILEACGVSSEQTLSGQSLMPWLTGESPDDWRRAHCTQMNGVELYYTQRIVMTKEYKYVYNGFDYDEFYDLQNDPHEMRNLAFPNLDAKRKAVLAGDGLKGKLPFPPLGEHLDAVRKDLLHQMWNFAEKHNDTIFNSYGTVALAPYGPGIGTDPSSPLSDQR